MILVISFHIDDRMHSPGFGNTAKGVNQSEAWCTQTQNAPACCKIKSTLVSITPAFSEADEDGNRLDRLPMIAGLCGGFFFGVIGLAFAAIKWVETRGQVKSQTLPRTRSVHAQRAEAGARASQMWNTPPSVYIPPSAPNGPRSPGSRDTEIWTANRPSVDRPVSNLPQAKQNQIRFTNIKPPSPIYASESPTSPPNFPPPAAPVARTESASKLKRTQSTSSRFSMRAASYTVPREVRESTVGLPGSYKALVSEEYEAMETDEVDLRMGDYIYVQKVFDDGECDTQVYLANAETNE